jgi:hypothetical protein
MFLVVSRLFLLFLLAADWAGDPYFGKSPLSRPFSSQEAFCHSMAHRVAVLHAVTRNWNAVLLVHASAEIAALNPQRPIRANQGEQPSLAMTDPLYAQMSLQC